MRWLLHKWGKVGEVKIYTGSPFAERGTGTSAGRWIFNPEASNSLTVLCIVTAGTQKCQWHTPAEQEGDSYSVLWEQEADQDLPHGQHWDGLLRLRDISMGQQQ